MRAGLELVQRGAERVRPAAQREAVRARDVPAMIAAGGNVYYLAKLAGILGLNVQDLGALQTGVELDEFKAGLMRHAMTERRVASLEDVQ